MPPKSIIKATAITPAPQAHPAWDHARSILAGITQSMRISLAGQVLLGLELKNLKKDLGFTHGSAKHFSPSRQVGDLEPDTWPAWVKKELGLADRTADRMIEMFEAARARLKKLAPSGTLPAGAEALALLCGSNPSAMIAEEREALTKVIERITDGETQKSLLEELRLIKRHVSLTGGDTSMHRKEPPSEQELMGQLAFKFFYPMAEALQSFRRNIDRDAFLYTIALHSSEEGEISLNALERDLEAALHDVRAAKKNRMKPATLKKPKTDPFA